MLASSHGAAPDTVTVCGTPRGVLPARFRLHDDDDSILPRVPDTGWMQDSDSPVDNLFAAARVRPIFGSGGNRANDENNIALDANTLNTEAPRQIAAGKDVTGTDDFWVSHVQPVFPGKLTADWDPGIPDPVTDRGVRLG